MSSAGGFTSPEPLDAHHVVNGFFCGKPELDDWLTAHALQSHRSGGSRTRVACRDGRVVGFYSLAAGGVEPEAAPNRVTKGLGRHSVPVVLLTRLAVDRSVQGAGLGVSLLQDAMIKVVEIAETVAVRALLVHAKDAEAKTWYLGHARFAESPADPMRLFLLIKDIKATLTAVR